MFLAGLLLTIPNYYSVYSVYSNWYISHIYVDWLMAGSCHQPVNIMHDI